MENNRKMSSIRLKEAIDYLKKNGVINNQKDLAEKLRVTPETITRAVKCQGNNPTANFLEKFATAYRDFFNESYIINGVSTLLKEPDTTDIPSNNKDTMYETLYKSALKRIIELERENAILQFRLSQYTKIKKEKTAV